MFQIQLKKLRERDHISQYKLAAALGVSQSTVGMWENGKNKPDVATLQKIADYFNVTTDYLLCRNSGTEEIMSDKDLKFALFGGAANITDDMIAEVRQFAEMVRLREKERKRKEQDNEYNRTNDL